ncbi:MAG: CBS domain-containing protein, partial [Gammaproteobacteria bacterium]|nr:CBS domain-containing protein [Gammaproteobacteria bacterium]NIS05524.1 CBS domain-containing protein [Gammaproteobacteria bacterium]NIV50799.1 CBS domain-containing protein [Gammaproteobacteria bacterium]
RGLEYRHDPVAVALGRTGVGAVMSRRFHTAPVATTLASAKRMFEGAPEWIVIADQGRILATVTEDQLDEAIADLEPDDDQEAVSLEAGHGESCAVVRTDASLREALAAMDEGDADVAVVTGATKRQ